MGSNSTCHNAFFVNDSFAGNLPTLSASEGWVASNVRESYDRRGRRTFVGPHADRRALIAELPLVDVVTGEQMRVMDLPPSPVQFAQPTPLRDFDVTSCDVVGLRRRGHVQARGVSAMKAGKPLHR